MIQIIVSAEQINFGRSKIGFSEVSLLGADGAEGGKELVVNHMRVIEQGANDALDTFDTGIIQWWAGVGLWDQVFLGTIDIRPMLVWRQLRFEGAGVPVFEEELIDVTVHGQAAFACNVVPCNVDACKFTASPVGCDGIMHLKGMEEVVSMLASGVLNAEVVDNEDKHHWAPIVTPETRCGGTLIVAVIG